MSITFFRVDDSKFTNGQPAQPITLTTQQNATRNGIFARKLTGDIFKDRPDLIDTIAGAAGCVGCGGQF